MFFGLQCSFSVSFFCNQLSMAYIQAYKNVKIVSERVSLVFELSVIFLSFQMGLSFTTPLVFFFFFFGAISEKISSLDP